MVKSGTYLEIRLGIGKIQDFYILVGTTKLPFENTTSPPQHLKFLSLLLKLWGGGGVFSLKIFEGGYRLTPPPDVYTPELDINI